MAPTGDASNAISGAPNCTRYLDQMREMILRTGTVAVDELSSEARVELTHRFRNWRQEEDRGPAS